MDFEEVWFKDADIQSWWDFQDFRSKTVIKEAIMENDFLKNLSSSQVN